jgi:hypothetical protein
MTTFLQPQLSDSVKESLGIWEAALLPSKSLNHFLAKILFPVAEPSIRVGGYYVNLNTGE